MAKVESREDASHAGNAPPDDDVKTVVKVESRGRQFSKRAVAVYSNADGLTESFSLNPSRVTLAKLGSLKAEALAALRAMGIDAAQYLTDGCHGSALRDAVINGMDHELDSLAGLASRIYEHAAHAEAYRKTGAVDAALNMMGTLGGLVALYDIYRQVSVDKKTAGRTGGKAAAVNRPGSHDAIERAAKELLDSGRAKQNIASLVAARLGMTATNVRRVLNKKRT